MRLDPHFGMYPEDAFKHCGDRRIRLHGGGGGIPIVSDVFDAVEDIASGAVDIVDSVVQEVGRGIDQAAQAVENTVTAALDDPVNTAIRIGATAVAGPAGLAAANAAISLGQGNSLEDAALSAGKSYALASAAGAMGGEAASYANEAGFSPEMSNIASGVAKGATSATLGGGDTWSGALSGGLNSALGQAAKSISDQAFEDWSREQAANAYDNSYSPTEQDVLAADPSIRIDYPLSTPVDQSVPGYFDEDTGKYIESEYGQYSSPLTDASGTNTMPQGSIGDALSSTSNQQGVSGSDLLAPPSEAPLSGYDPALSKNQIKKGLDFASNAILNPQSNAGLSAIDYSFLSPLTSAPAAAFALPEFLDTSAKYLNNIPTATTTAANNPSQMRELKQLYSSLDPDFAPAMDDRGLTAPQAMDQYMQSTKFMAGGGLAESSKTVESLFKDPVFNKIATPNMLPAAPLMSNPMKLNPLRHLHESLTSRQRTAGGLAAGGLPQKYAEALPEGHKPEFITGLTGYYASGKGTGQSDDIDAMLHDGDYVADADLVAALGDGSSKAGAEALEKFRRQIPHQQHATGGAAVPAKIADGEYVFPSSFVTAIGQGDNKAGAKILDKMREAIRAHKRSAPTTKIPPKAKSPLDYLKMVKG